MTTEENLLWLEMESDWDIRDCQCSECQVEEPTEIDRSCEPASYRELWLLGVGGLVWATWCAWMAW